MIYYLIEGKIMKGTKMPKFGDFTSNTKGEIKDFEWKLGDWKDSLQPCEISESELEKINNKVYTFNNCHADNPIEVTDIVESEITRVVCIDCPNVKNSKSPKCIEGCEASKTIIKFKQD